MFYGASAPRRECGVRRREPECRATGVHQIKGAPTESEILWGEKRLPARAVFFLFIEFSIHFMYNGVTEY